MNYLFPLWRIEGTEFYAARGCVSDLLFQWLLLVFQGFHVCVIRSMRSYISMMPLLITIEMFYRTITVESTSRMTALHVLSSLSSFILASDEFHLLRRVDLRFHLVSEFIKLFFPTKECQAAQCLPSFLIPIFSSRLFH